MTGWNFADVWELVVAQIPDAPAQIHGDRRITWSEFDRRADGVARYLLDAGVVEQDKVAQYLYNCPEYLESVYAAFKAGLVPINTNYRYTDSELVYLWDNADTVAVVFHAVFTETIERIRDQLPRIVTWLWVDDGSGACPDWATPYEDAAATEPGERPVEGPWGRSGDHLSMIYTGGTTGMPKGVMWRQHDLFCNLVGNFMPDARERVDPELITAQVAGPGPIGMPACPLMHGTGQYTQLIVMSLGGSVVTLEGRKLDVIELLDTVEREKVQQIALVGDAFTKPILAALDAEPDRWDLSNLFLIASSGVMWSEESKKRLLAYQPGMILVDAFSSSEAIGMGQSTSTAGGTSNTAKFVLGDNARVLNDANKDVEPGSGETGRVALKGYVPVGYYKDEEKTARTFLEIDGQRYVIPGDYARVEADGSLTLLGRGSVVINTGGEKVFPEEVEEALKTHPSVADAVAVGVPDDKFGEAVVAVVEPADPAAGLDEAVLIAHVKERLAAYKAPKQILPIDTIGRAPNAKVDYKRLKAFARETIGV
ncbi:MAG TPA: acyl-CoA synthetase [Acidimicrobiales bacterium]|nr:acyl-CoA synthetase [Acidimicrobiales bacterium]